MQEKNKDAHSCFSRGRIRLLVGVCILLVLGNQSLRFAYLLQSNIIPGTDEADTERTDETDQAVIFNIGGNSNGQGFGSMFICAMFLGSYYDKPHLNLKNENGTYPRRRLIINEHTNFTKYRWNQTHGMFHGFFQTQYQNGKNHGMEIVQDLSALPFQTNCSFPYDDTRSWECKAISIHTHSRGPPSNQNFYSFRDKGMRELETPSPSRPTNNITAWMTNTTRSLRIFSNMMEYTCRNLPRQRIHPAIQSQIDDIISSFWKTNTNGNQAKKISLAFHIRRTDKNNEYFFNDRRYYAAEQYVKTLLEQYQAPPYHQDAEKEEESYCFVATDDYAAVNELRNALQHYNFNCTLLTMTAPDYQPTRSATDLIMVLAQIQLLVQAEVFVGTFSSNIAGLVSLWRGCEYHYNHKPQQQLPAIFDASVDTTTEPNFDNKFHHYFQSYGADVQDWFFL